MNETVNFLKECGVFFIATVEGDQPRVRPFGAVIEYEGKLYICTNNTKNVFNQIKNNPKVEISAKKGGNWIRITGTVVPDQRIEVKEKFLQECPLPMYKADDDIFEILYFEEISSIVYSFTEEPVVLI